MDRFFPVSFHQSVKKVRHESTGRTHGSISYSLNWENATRQKKMYEKHLRIFVVLFLSPKEVKSRFPDGLPLLDPIEDMGIKDDGLKSVIRVSVLLVSTDCVWTAVLLSSDLLTVIHDNLYSSILSSYPIFYWELWWPKRSGFDPCPALLSRWLPLSVTRQRALLEAVNTPHL